MANFIKPYNDDPSVGHFSNNGRFAPEQSQKKYFNLFMDWKGFILLPV